MTELHVPQLWTNHQLLDLFYLDWHGQKIWHFYLKKIDVDAFSEQISILLDAVDRVSVQAEEDALFYFETQPGHLWGRPFWDQYLEVNGLHRIGVHAELMHRLCSRIEGLTQTTLWHSGADYNNIHLELAVVCNFRVLSQAEFFSCRYLSSAYGLPPVGWSCQKLPEWLGYQKTVDAILTGRPLSLMKLTRRGFFVKSYADRPDLLQLARDGVWAGDHVEQRVHPSLRDTILLNGKGDKFAFKYFRDLMATKNAVNQTFGAVVIDLIESYSQKPGSEMWPKHLECLTLLSGADQTKSLVYMATVERRYNMPLLLRSRQNLGEPIPFRVKLVGLSSWATRMGAYLLFKGYRISFWENHPTKVHKFLQKVEVLCLHYVNTYHLDRSYLAGMMSRISILGDGEQSAAAQLTIFNRKLSCVEQSFFLYEKHPQFFLSSSYSFANVQEGCSKALLFPLIAGAAGRLMEVQVGSTGFSKDTYRDFMAKLHLSFVWLPKQSRSFATDLLVDTWNQLLALISSGYQPQDIARKLKNAGFDCCLMDALKECDAEELERVMDIARTSKYYSGFYLEEHLKHLDSRDFAPASFFAQWGATREQYLQNIQHTTSEMISRSIFHFHGDKSLPEKNGIEDRALWSMVRFALLAKVSREYLHTDEELDLLSVHLVGFPRHLGGCIEFIRTTGIKKVVQKLAEMTQECGPHFRLPPAVDLSQIESCFAEPKQSYSLVSAAAEVSSTVSPSNIWPNREKRKFAEPPSGQ
ncbi:MAG: hypothetical protein OXT67_10025 [Zetaproteobacteria bacterium]|nr:hypothetical protein [Zetaproteobacteria bacterium]